MLKRHSVAKVVAATLSLSALGFASSVSATDAINASNGQAPFQGGMPIEGQYIVVLKDNSPAMLSAQSIEDRKAIASNIYSELAANSAANVTMQYHNALNGFVASGVDMRGLQALRNDPRVAYVEQDQIMQATATQSGATWGIDRIDQASLPLDGSYSYTTTASNVSMFIVDTGVLGSHSEFSGRMQPGYSAIAGGTDDCNGHGTHVAGTAAGSTYGVAKGAKIYPVRVLDCNGSGSNSGVIAGVDWVAANASLPAVANMSLGGGNSTALDAAVDRAIDKGIVFAVAAGNSNSDACSGSPNKVPRALTVASSTSSDARSSFSSWGSCIDVFAPGSNIKSAWHTGGTNTISGTSMASPHVAGAAALYLADNPSASVTAVNNHIVNSAVTGKISDPKGSPNRLLQVNGGSTTPPPPPPPGGSLTKGTPVTGISGATGSEQFWTIDVPAGASNLTFNTSGGSGDADLYVRFGAKPTTSTYDCRPYKGGNTESCSFASPQTGTYHVMLRGYSAYSSVSLVADYTAGGTTPPTGGGSTLTDLSATTGNWLHYTLQVPAGMSALDVDISGGSGDADLYVRRGAQPTTSSYNCRPYKYGNTEACSFSNPAADTWHISIRAYSSFSGVTLKAYYKP